MEFISICLFCIILSSSFFCLIFFVIAFCFKMHYNSFKVRQVVAGSIEAARGKSGLQVRQDSI